MQTSGDIIDPSGSQSAVGETGNPPESGKGEGALPPPPPPPGGGGGLVGIASGVWAGSPPGLPWGSRGGWGARGFGFNSDHGGEGEGEGEACTDLPCGCAAAGDSATAAGRRWGWGRGRGGGEVVGTDGIIYEVPYRRPPVRGIRPSFFFFEKYRYSCAVLVSVTWFVPYLRSSKAIAMFDSNWFFFFSSVKNKKNSFFSTVLPKISKVIPIFLIFL